MDQTPLSFSAWYRFRRPSRTLRLGLLCDASGVGRWLVDTLESLLSLPEIALTDVFLTTSAPPQAPPALFQKFKTWSLTGAPDSFELCTEFETSVRRHTLSGRGGLSEEDRDLIRSRQLDVLLCVTDSALAGDCSNLSAWGVWSFLLGAPEFIHYQPPFWREVYEGASVTQICLLNHDACFEHGRMLDSLATATVPSLRFTQNRVVPLDAAVTLLGRSLLKTAALEMPASKENEIELNAAPHRWPTAAEIGPFIGTKLVRSAVVRAAARGKSIRWSVGIRPVPSHVDFQNPASGPEFKELPAPEGQFYADPFVVEHMERHWLFFENWVDAQQRGSLSCLEVLGDGTFGDSAVILERPYHLSFPNVFSHAGEFFMIPESCGDLTVQLYRATKFPFEWKLEAVLMDKIALVDTTALQYDGKWYFFTSTDPTDHAEQGYLFLSDSIDGKWQYHPANPVCTDTRSLRSAGAIFSQNGKLIRPTQDCSKLYGYAVNFNEIVRLSPTEFEERRLGRMLPTWAGGLIGTHSFHFNSKYQVVDGQRLTGSR